MKRWIVCAAALAVVLLAGKSGAGTDIARLEPVQILQVSGSAGQVAVRTDTGQHGEGDDLDAAVADMKAAADGEIFLDTVECLLIDRDSIDWLPALMQQLRPACRICRCDGVPDLEAAASYLSIHKPGVTLRQYRQGEYQLPLLYQREGRMYLAEP